MLSYPDDYLSSFSNTAIISRHYLILFFLIISYQNIVLNIINNHIFPYYSVDVLRFYIVQQLFK